MQIVHYLLYLNVDYTEDLSNFMREQSIVNLEVIPNWVVHEFLTGHGKTLFGKFESEGVTTNIIDNSFQPLIVLFLICIVQ